MLKQTTAYLPVDINEKLPEIGETISLSFDGGKTFSYETLCKGWLPQSVTHWLKPSTGYFFSEEELKEFEAAAREDEAVRFAEWILKESVLPRDVNWFDAGKHYTTSQLYQLFKTDTNGK